MKIKHGLRYAAAIIVAAGAGAVAVPSAAQAHGAMMMPGSRTFLCWQDGLTQNGAITPKNPACAAAVAQSGVTGLYNWFAVLRSDGAGRMAGFIPNGQLCSGGTGGPYDFTGFNLARNDFPVTHLTSGSNIRVDYNNWAKHPGTFSLYITKDSWSPTRALAWSDLEATPFDRVTNPPSIGGPGTVDGRYSWNATLPSGKSGRHIIYSVWSRSDSTETFYNCSDVVFDGGNGQVTGIGGNGTPNNPPSSPPVNNPPSSPPVNNPPSSPPVNNPPVTGSCSATYTAVNSWSGGFQANVTVRAGSSALNGWSTSFAFPGGQTVSQVWGGKSTGSGSNVRVSNEGWNGALAAGATATFGLIGTGAAPASVGTVACTSP